LAIPFLLHFKRCDNRGNIKDIRAEPRFFGNRAYGQIYVYQMDLSLKGTFILILSLFEKRSIKGMSEIDRKPFVILILPLWKSGVGNYRRMDWTNIYNFERTRLLNRFWNNPNFTCANGFFPAPDGESGTLFPLRMPSGRSVLLLSGLIEKYVRATHYVTT